MPEFLLTKAEWEAIITGLPAGDTCGQCREAISQAALRKVAVWVKRNSNPCSPIYPHGAWRTIWDYEKWNAFMREAGLAEKEVLDA